MTKEPFVARRIRIALGLAFGATAAFAGVVGHAHGRRADRARDEAALAALAQVLPANDLALSGGARWLRFPSWEEPGAAFADAPALADADPAGGSMAPPVGVWIEEAAR
jgi:hypothetical protein